MFNLNTKSQFDNSVYFCIYGTPYMVIVVKCAHKWIYWEVSFFSFDLVELSNQFDRNPSKWRLQQMLVHVHGVKSCAGLFVFKFVFVDKEQ